MKTWQKITIIILILFVGVLAYLYYYGQQTAPLDDSSSSENPVFPFESSEGREGGNFFNNDDTGLSEDGDATEDNTPDRLWRISDRPVAGSQWVTRDDESEAIWYVLKENGHVYEYNIEDRDSERLTNTTIPRVQEVLISPNRDHIIYRYVDNDTGNIKTYLASVSKTPDGNTSYTINGSFLPDNLSSVNLSPKGQKVFSIQDTVDGSAGILYTTSTGEGELLFESPLREWRSRWNNDSTITLFTTPSINSLGVAYSLDTETGDKKKLINGLGLTASVSPEEEYLLVSTQESGSYRSRLYEINDLRTSIITPSTLREKCEWGDDTLFCGIPDSLPNQPLKDWYQGKITFTDQLVSFTLSDRSQFSYLNEDELHNGPFDIIDIQPAKNTNHLMFTNKRDDNLWGVRLRNE